MKHNTKMNDKNKKSTIKPIKQTGDNNNNNKLYFYRAFQNRAAECFVKLKRS